MKIGFQSCLTDKICPSHSLQHCIEMHVKSLKSLECLVDLPGCVFVCRVESSIEIKILRHILINENSVDIGIGHGRGVFDEELLGEIVLTPAF